MKLSQAKIQDIIKEELLRAKVLREAKFEYLYANTDWYDHLWDFFQKVKDVFGKYDDYFFIQYEYGIGGTRHVIDLNETTDSMVSQIIKTADQELARSGGKIDDNDLITIYVEAYDPPKEFDYAPMPIELDIEMNGHWLIYFRGEGKESSYSSSWNDSFEKVIDKIDKDLAFVWTKHIKNMKDVDL